MKMSILPSKKEVTFDKIKTTLAKGKKIATARETVMDQRFIEQSRYDWFWVSGENTPKEAGWYKVNRKNQKLIKISNKNASKLTWHERLFIYKSTVKDNSILALYIGDECKDGRLSALYLCGPDCVTRVAQK